MLLVLGSMPVPLEALTSQAQLSVLRKPIKKATLTVKAKNEDLFIVSTLGRGEKRSCNAHFPFPHCPSSRSWQKV